jgi:hypothetical protein
MEKKTQYILDAIKNNGPNTPVKVVVNGIVTTIKASLALDQLHKPSNARKPIWKNAQPFLEVSAISAASAIEVNSIIQIEPSISEEIELEEPAIKRKKKQTDESNES